MATTTFSPRGTVDESQTTTQQGRVLERSNGVTRRGFLRLLGSVAATGAVAAAGANGLSESAHARRHGKKRRKGHTDQPRLATKSAIEATVLEPGLADGDLEYAGGRCRWRWVCYPNGVCSRRRVCWY